MRTGGPEQQPFNRHPNLVKIIPTRMAKVAASQNLANGSSITRSSGIDSGTFSKKAPYIAMPPSERRQIRARSLR
jgi:hypothetical protein